MAAVTSLRILPSVDQLLRSDVAAELRSQLGKTYLTTLARQVTDEMRAELRADQSVELTKESMFEMAVDRLRVLALRETTAGLRRVINATGVILHTNLGRAPLSDAARTAVLEAAGYCSLEYDIATGSRGKRGGRVEELLGQLTGAEAALVVNNCAAAALLILTVLGGDGETIVSRGELVEIGGDFRVPDVMSNSGTKMIEVGSTNRTRLQDYRGAISNNTRVILRVHPSNYRIVGFTDAPRLSELAELAHSSELILYEDAGSGVISDLSEFGLQDEPIISESIEAGADVVSFSGDKLLGAPQAGLIVGGAAVIDRLRRHSLYRALRADKLCLAALEATLDAHRRGALTEIPALQMLAQSSETIASRAAAFAQRITAENSAELIVTLQPGESAVGGGSGPNVHPKTTLVTLRHNTLSAEQIETRLRDSSPPIICRIADDAVLVDLRTVTSEDEQKILQVLKAI